jgi:hypothetical protein
MGWLSSNKKRSFAEKLMKDIRAREEKENVDVIGKVSPEIQAQRDAENTLAKNSQKMQQIKEVRQKEDEKQEGQLLAIHGAKIKFNSHMGEFKVLNDVPTTQGKLTGTTVEKQILNFTFYDGFQMLSLTEWQDFGTVKVQDNEALIKKSTLPGTGKMPGNVPPESGKIEFVDSGQVNVPESITTTGAPVPENVDDNTEYIYYSKEGLYLGGIESSPKVYLSTQGEYDKAKKDKKWSLINKESNLLKENGKNITNNDFSYISYVVKMESGDNDLKELKCIAFASYNRSRKVNKTWRGLLSTTYSSVPNKKLLSISDKDSKSINTRKAVISVLLNETDITKGAEFWDGTDFLAWGNSEQNPYNKLGQNKFDEYKFIEIPKDVYTDFVGAQSLSTTYPDKGNHTKGNDHGSHEHITIKKKEKEVKKIKYKIPAAEFTDNKNWKSGNFYYETGIKATNGISGTISAGKSIFWKLTPNRLLK